MINGEGEGGGGKAKIKNARPRLDTFGPALFISPSKMPDVSSPVAALALYAHSYYFALCDVRYRGRYRKKLQAEIERRETEKEASSSDFRRDLIYTWPIIVVVCAYSFTVILQSVVFYFCGLWDG